MTANEKDLVQVSNVDKVFKRGSEEVHVLGGLDLQIPEGEFLALMGPSQRVSRRHGPVGLRQVDAAEPDWRTGPAQPGLGNGGR